MSRAVRTLKRGDYFVTTGEMMAGSARLGGAGDDRTCVRDAERTFPMEVVGLVRGDGRTTERRIASARGPGPFGRYGFRIPFSAAGRKRARFAARDSARSGAVAQPVRPALPDAEKDRNAGTSEEARQQK